MSFYFLGCLLPLSWGPMTHVAPSPPSLHTSCRSKAMLEINSKIEKEQEYLVNAPYKTPVRRLNETKANRELDINYYK